jgi:hypothetical protein
MMANVSFGVKGLAKADAWGAAELRSARTIAGRDGDPPRVSMSNINKSLQMRKPALLFPLNRHYPAQSV